VFFFLISVNQASMDKECPLGLYGYSLFAVVDYMDNPISWTISSVIGQDPVTAIIQLPQGLKFFIVHANHNHLVSGKYPEGASNPARLTQ
jgi:hypothetical protein